MFSLLKQLYPFETDVVKAIRTNLLFGLFVAVFLWVFQPFQLVLWQTDYKTWKIIGYGVVTFAVQTFFLLVINMFFSPEKLEKSWTVGKEILLLSLYLMAIALANTIYSALLGIVNITPKVFFGFIPVVFCVGIFPISARVLMLHQWFKEKNKKGAAVLNSEMKSYNNDENTLPNKPDEKIHLIAENEKDNFDWFADRVLYLESLDNYVKVVYISENDTIHHIILRGSLKRFERQVSVPFIRRCHRSFMANLHRVDEVTGNAQGYTLHFKNENIQIPVSRAFGQEILSFVSHKKK
jgi:hypothetical protein